MVFFCFFLFDRNLVPFFTLMAIESVYLTLCVFIEWFGKWSGFCIIEGPETVRDFVQMQLQEIHDNIRSRRNRIFLLMEEVRLTVCRNVLDDV